MPTFDELRSQYGTRNQELGIPEASKPVSSFDALRTQYGTREMPVSSDDPANPNFLENLFREPIELGKILAMTPVSINQYENLQNTRKESLDKVDAAYKKGEINYDTFVAASKPFMEVEEVPKGISVTSEQIVGDVLGTLLWVTPFQEVKALKGMSILSRLARGSALGGSFAGAYGMSENAKPDEILKQMGIGAAFGGALEFVAPYVFKGIQKPFQTAGNIIKKGLEKTYPIWEKIAPTYYRLEKLGPMGKKIADSLFSADENQLFMTGNRLANIMEAGFDKLNATENTVLRETMEGKIKPESLTANVRKVYDAVKQVMTQDIGADAKSKIKGFKPRKDYFPHDSPGINILTKGKTRENILNSAVAEGIFPSKAEAEMVLNSYLEYAQTGGSVGGKGEYWLKWLVKSGRVKSLQESQKITDQYLQLQGLKTRFGKLARFPEYGHLEEHRVLDFPFYNRNPQEVIPMYIINATRRLESIAEFGKNGQKLTKIVGLLRTELEKTNQRMNIPKLNRLFDTALGVVNNASDKEKLGLLMRAIQVPKLTFAPILNIGQSINTLMATDLPSLASGIKAAFTQEGQMAALRSGATLDSVIREITRVVGGGSEFMDRYLRYTGFAWTEKFNRTVASNAGMQYALKLQKKLIANPADAFIQDALKELRINPTEILSRDLNKEELLRAGQLISNATQFRARPLDLPRFASTPEGKLVFQFKNFVYNQTMFLKRQFIDELASKHYGRFTRNIIILGTVFPMTGEVLGDIRSLITGSQRPTQFFDRYLQNLADTGGIGIFMDVLNSAKYGQLSDFVVGPSATMLLGIMEKLYKISTTHKVTEADLRWLGQQAGPVRILTTYLFPPDNPDRQTILDSLKDL